MENPNDNEESEHPLSNDPEENLRMENELLRLKLKAELGAEPHSISTIDPEIENEFLKHVLAFEHNYAHSKQTKLYDLLGKPDFKRSDELNDDLIEDALQEITDFLFQKNIVVSFSGEYASRTKYIFITEELFDHETNDFMLPGMTMHFDYEEFHPDHKLDIENKALEFLSGWFNQSLDEHSWELADTFILPDRTILSKGEVAAQLKRIFDAYTSFNNQEYIINEISFNLQEDTGLGHAEGAVRYSAVLENGEIIDFNGPFKLYLSLDYGCWSIFHIVFPGFEY